MGAELVSLSSDFYGNEALLAKWKESCQKNRIPHALFLVGDDELENISMAWALSQSLLCEKKDQAMPCGLCGNCLRIKNRSSESILEVKPIKNSIRLEELKDFSQFFNLRGWSERKVILIHQAHLLNPSAANRLLKSIEEPPENTYFILTSESPKQVMATIRSRCQSLSLAGGRRLPVVEAEIVDLSFRFLHSIFDPKTDFWTAKWKEDFKDRNLTRQVLSVMQFILRDLMLYSINGSVIHTDRMEEIDKLAQLQSAAFWFQFFDKLFVLEAGVKQNLDSLLQLESLFVQMRALIAVERAS